MKLEKYLVFFFFLFSVLHQTIGQKDNLIFLRLCNLIGIYSFVYILVNVKNFFNSKEAIYNSILFKILLICVFSTLIVEIINNRIYLLNLIYPISFISISFLIVKSRPSPTPFIIVSCLVFLYLFSLFLRGIPPNEWIKGSRNYVSVLVLYLTITTICITYLSQKKETLVVYLYMPLITLTIAILALGRSGIITSVLLVLFCLSRLFVRQIRNVYMLSVLLVTLTLVSYYFLQNLDYIQDSFLYKFERRGMDLDERAVVLDLYLRKIDLSSFFYGLPNLDFIFSTQGITLHNSYLNWHYNYGFGAFVLAFLSVISIVKLLFIDRFFGLLLIVILFRSFSDQILLSDGILIGLPFILIFAIYDFQIKLRDK